MNTDVLLATLSINHARWHLSDNPWHPTDRQHRRNLHTAHEIFLEASSAHRKNTMPLPGLPTQQHQRLLPLQCFNTYKDLLFYYQEKLQRCRQELVQSRIISDRNYLREQLHKSDDPADWPYPHNTQDSATIRIYYRNREQNLLRDAIKDFSFSYKLEPAPEWKELIPGSWRLHPAELNAQAYNLKIQANRLQPVIHRIPFYT